MADVDGEAWLRRTRMLDQAIAIAPRTAHRRMLRSLISQRSIDPG
jgi:hypothetical protein